MHSTPKKRILFLINVRSGGRRSVAILQALKQYVAAGNTDIQAEELNYQRSLNSIIDPTAIDIVVVGGGDGTISTLIPQLTALKIPIGILPLGTGNDLARELGVLQSVQSKSVEQIIKFYREAPNREITYFNLEYGNNFSDKTSFINYVSFGFDATIIDKFARLRELKWWHPFRGVWSNRLGYAGLCLANLTHKITATSSISVRSTHTSFSFTEAKSIIFTNIQSIMGMGRSNQHSSVFDEKVECLVTNKLINYLTMIIRLRTSRLDPQFLGSFSQWEVENLPIGIPVQIDGEPRPDIKSDRYRVSPGGRIVMKISSPV